MTSPDFEPAPGSPIPPSTSQPPLARRKFYVRFELHEDGTATGGLVPLASLTPEARAELAEKANPANWSEAARRDHAQWERVTALGLPDQGLAAGPLPHGAIAAAVRDPGAGVARRGVVPPGCVSAAASALGTRWKRSPSATLPRTLSHGSSVSF